MNRRSFIYGAAVMAGAVNVPAATPELKRRIKAGFLGGEHSHALGKYRLVKASEDFELVGMAEVSAEVRGEYEKLGARFLSAEELIAASEVVFVESAVRDHARHAKMVLKAGKHAHVEKPPSDNLADIEEMVRLAGEKKLVMQVGYMWRYHPGFQAIFEAVRNGWLGNIYLVRGMISNQIEAGRRAEWGEFKGGGQYELGSHLIDAMIRLMGEPESVTPFLRKDGQGADGLKDNNLAVFQFPGGMGLVQNSLLQPNSGRQRVFEVFGTNGSATLRPIEPPALELELAKPAGPYKAGIQSVTMPKYERYLGDIQDLAACVRRDRLPAVSLAEEVLVQKWLLRACQMQARRTFAVPFAENGQIY